MSMKHLRFAVLALIIAVAAMSFPGTARAEVKIAVVDFQRILTESTAGKSLQKQLDDAQKSFQDDMRKQDQALQATQAQLNKDEGKNSSDIIQKKADFEKKVVEARQDAAKKKDNLEKAANTAVNELRSQAAEVIGDMAQKEKFSLVLNKGTVIMAEKSMDITDDVLKGLNAKVQKIDLKL
jgi:outer membrane protein